MQKASTASVVKNKNLTSGSLYYELAKNVRKLDLDDFEEEYDEFKFYE